MGAEIAGNSGHLSMAATRDNRLTAVTLGRLSLEEFFTRICLAVEDLEFEVARCVAAGLRPVTTYWVFALASWPFCLDRKVCASNFPRGKSQQNSSLATPNSKILLKQEPTPRRSLSSPDLMTGWANCKSRLRVDFTRWSSGSDRATTGPSRQRGTPVY